jgi:hypothetical protein
MTTQSITAYVEFPTIDDTVPFHVTEIETERYAGWKTGKATVKGILDADIEEMPRATATVAIKVATEGAVEPWNENLESETTIFVGMIDKATQSESGEITFNVVGMKDFLKNYEVKLRIDRRKKAYIVLLNLINELFSDGHTIYYTDAYSFAGAGKKAYLEPPIGPVGELRNAVDINEDVKNDNGGRLVQEVWISENIGNQNSGVPFNKVLQDTIIPRIQGTAWVDRFGIIRFEGFPPYVVWKDAPVISLGAGNQTRSKSRVIYTYNTGTSELGPAAASIQTELNPSAESEIPEDADAIEEPPAPEQKLYGRNISARAGENASYSTALEEEQNKILGSVEIIGNGRIELFDQITIPEYKSNNIDSFGDPLGAYQSGTYTIQAIRHKINTSNGFTTELTLSPPIEDSVERIIQSRDGGSAAKENKLNQVSKRIAGEVSSGIDNGQNIDSTGLSFVETFNPFSNK